MSINSLQMYLFVGVLIFYSGVTCAQDKKSSVRSGVGRELTSESEASIERADPGPCKVATLPRL
jgi:hypothetical protein